MLVNQKRLLVEWFDECTTALFLAAGMPIQQLFKSHGVVGFPLVDVKARFIVPSSFGDQLIAESTVLEFRRSSFVLRHQYFKDRVLAVEGVETRVWAGPDPHDPKRMKSQPLPADVIARLSAG
jgi:4-hydroxybenzoyl-CoA thioesterase